MSATPALGLSEFFWVSFSQCNLKHCAEKRKTMRFKSLVRQMHFTEEKIEDLLLQVVYFVDKLQVFIFILPKVQ